MESHIHSMPFINWPFAFRNISEDTVLTPLLLIAWNLMYFEYAMPEYFERLSGQRALHAEVYELVNQAVNMRLAGHDNKWLEFNLNLTGVHISAGKLIFPAHIFANYLSPPFVMYVKVCFVVFIWSFGNKSSWSISPYFSLWPHWYWGNMKLSGSLWSDSHGCGWNDQRYI